MKQKFLKISPKNMRLKLDAKYLACRSKAKAKPQRSELAGSAPTIVTIGRRTLIDIEPGKYSFSDYEVSKTVTYLLRHSQHVHREEDGAVHFWGMKKIYRISSHSLLIGVTVCGKHAWQQEEEIKGDSSTVLMLQDQFFICERCKDTQDAILLILHNRTI